MIFDKMLESFIVSVLNKYLTGYIAELNQKNLRCGIFSGKIELKNAQIEPSALVCSCYFIKKKIQNGVFISFFIFIIVPI